MAQWITRLTTDQKIAGSNPARVIFFLLAIHNHIRLSIHLHNVINPFVHAMKQFESFCCLSLYTHLSTLQINWLQNYTSSSWPCGVMDNASDFGSEDCRFESCQGRFFLFDSTCKAISTYFYTCTVLIPPLFVL